jgi:hypothetical protein
MAEMGGCSKQAGGPRPLYKSIERRCIAADSFETYQPSPRMCGIEFRSSVNKHNPQVLNPSDILDVIRSNPVIPRR